MGRLLVHWGMIKFLPLEILVISHVTLVMSQLLATLGPVRVMGTGVALMLSVEEVILKLHTSNYITRSVL